MEQENAHIKDQSFVKAIKEYLLAYKNKYDFDSVFSYQLQIKRCR